MWVIDNIHDQMLRCARRPYLTTIHGWLELLVTCLTLFENMQVIRASGTRGEPQIKEGASSFT